jgi:thymidylate synthase (FAD)
MEVKLAGHSVRVGAGPDETLVDQVAYFARVSNPTSQMAGMNNERLIRYLIRHHHWSPFEMVSVNLQVDTTRDIARQMLRHRSFSFQEFSQRYSATETSLGTREVRLQDTANRQNSLETDDPDLKKWWADIQVSLMANTFDAYDAALKKGIAKEVARSILPEGLTWTRLYMAGTLRSWVHYCQLRCGPETQKEHREVAEACADQLARVFPFIRQAIMEHGE